MDRIAITQCDLSFNSLLLPMFKNITLVLLQKLESDTQEYLMDALATGVTKIPSTGFVSQIELLARTLGIYLQLSRNPRQTLHSYICFKYWGLLVRHFNNKFLGLFLWPKRLDEVFIGLPKF